MITINEILDLNGFKFENCTVSVIENENKDGGLIKITNQKDTIETTMEYNNRKRIRTLRVLERVLGTRIDLESLNETEVLAYIENEGFSKTLWSPLGKAMHDFNMIEEGDRVAVGLSGGKDSMTVLNALIRIQKISRVKFEIIPIHIHPVEDIAKTDKMKKYCKKLGLEVQIIETKLADMLFGESGGTKVNNPCFLCARIRRGILYTAMKEQGINKLVLGHHKDDIIETFLMNSFYQGNQNMMKPAYVSEEYGVKVIRPLAYVEESEIIRYVRKMNLPILKSECPYETDTNSKRLRIKNLIKELATEDENVRSIIFQSIKEKLY